MMCHSGEHKNSVILSKGTRPGALLLRKSCAFIRQVIPIAIHSHGFGFAEHRYFPISEIKLDVAPKFFLCQLIQHCYHFLQTFFSF